MFTIIDLWTLLPVDVLSQVYNLGQSGPGRDFGGLDLTGVVWRACDLAASEVVGSRTVWPDFVEANAGAARRWAAEGFVGHPRVEAWGRLRTWERPPVFVAGALMGDPSGRLWLIEGHHRVGYLAGLVAAGHIAADSTHRAWVGCPRP